VLATRRHKPEVEHSRFDEAWKTEAEAAGWGPDAAERLVAWSRQRAGHTVDGCWHLDEIAFDQFGRPEHVQRLVDPEEWIADLLRTELTARTSTFRETDLVEAIAARQAHGATVETIERIAARVLASDNVVALAPDEHGRRWTSRELVDVETRFLAAVRAPATRSPVPADAVAAAVDGRPSLGEDQLAAVRVLAASCHPVSVLVGPAGTGKTFTLDAVRAAFEHAGHTVQGAAPSARAAFELRDGASIPARTLHSLLDRWQRGHEMPAPDSLLVIDEAGMADIRTLEAVVSRHVAAGGRVLLVGDHHQLPEVGAGGGFAAAVVHAGSVAELTVNRRQRYAWEQDALTELRHGSVAGAVEAYMGHDRVVVAGCFDAMITAAVDRWFAARDAELSPVLLAGTNDTVDRLNAAVIGRLVERGELDEEPAAFGTGRFRVGERVVVRRNSTERTAGGPSVNVANGDTGVVSDAAPGKLVVRLDRRGEEIVLTEDYLARGGHVTHAYALTTHRAQGGTWDLAIAVGSEGLYREGAYVQLSRGVTENWLVLTEPEAVEMQRAARIELQRHDAGLAPPDETAEVGEELLERLGRSRVKHLAHAHDAEVDTVDWLARSLILPELEVRHAEAAAAERIATDSLDLDVEEMIDRLTRIDHVARHLAIGSPVSPADRHNVGTVVAFDDEAGRATVQFISDDGHDATRSFAWDELRLLGASGEPRVLSPAARQSLDVLTGELTEPIERWRATVRRLGAEPGDADRYARAIECHVERVADTLWSERPVWLTGLLGGRPDDVAGANAWDDAVHDIARWRAEHLIADDTPGLGERPGSADDAAQWDPLQARLGLTRTWLATTDRIEAADTVVASYGELMERRAELDELFARAPADWRATIHQLQSGQLGLDDTTELLQSALEGQRARRHWIVANWPHVVEYQEINRTLTTATWGPDPQLLSDLLTQPLTAALTHAIECDEPWLRLALCRLADGNTTQLNDAAIAWLEQVVIARTHGLAHEAVPLNQLAWSSTESAAWLAPDLELVSIDDSLDL
jgi:hypothetical protein